MFTSSNILQKELLSNENDITKQSNKETGHKYNYIGSYQWHTKMCKPYRQCIEHELIIDYWSRHAKLFQNHSIAGILIYLITNYSVPAFKFRYGNENKVKISDEGLLCHQLLKTQCSVLFGPRIKYDALDANMIYRFKFHMISGNIGIGICANDFIQWNTLLHNIKYLRSSIIWKNGYYNYNKRGTNTPQSIKEGHIDDIFKDNELVELEINFVKLKCFIRNLSDKKIRKHELPMTDLLKYRGATGYLQIVIGFFDDFGHKSWVKGAGVIKIIEQRGEYVPPEKHSINKPLF